MQILTRSLNPLFVTFSELGVGFGEILITGNLPGKIAAVAELPDAGRKCKVLGNKFREPAHLFPHVTADYRAVTVKNNKSVFIAWRLIHVPVEVDAHGKIVGKA